MADVTQILSQIEQGDPSACDQLLPLVYEELRKLAAARLANESVGQTLQPTALVHEAWLKLAGTQQSWNGRRHFFGAASEAMRRILIDRARKRHRKRHGGGRERIQIDTVELATKTDDGTLLELNEALEKFSLESPQQSELVKLRYIVGLTLAEAANALDISVATAKRHWSYARAWLLCELRRE